MSYIPNEHLPYQIETEYGTVLGTRCGNPRITVFRGIPYAKPPVGELRFRDPQKMEKWAGIRDCTRFAPSSIMPNMADEFYQNEFHLYPMESSEDCLYLNIWTPARKAAEKLPVMFWIHGGGNFQGYSHEMEFDGEALAKRGIILVTVGYRLSVLGFLPHTDLTKRNNGRSTGYLGLQDLVFALEWVHTNIENFGGDPECVTVFGQSAGGADVVAFLASPLTEGKFHRAIIQSGFMHNPEFPPKPEAIEAEQKAKCEKVGLTVNDLLAMNPQELTDKFYFDENGEKKWANFGMGNAILDGWFLNDTPPQSLLEGKSKNIPVMIGTVFGDGHMMFGDGEDKVIYQNAVRGSLKVAKARLKYGQLPVYAYLFDRHLPGNELCPENHSYHSSDLWYVFGTFHRSLRPLNGRDFDLSNQVIEYWTNFARTGNPNSADTQTQWTAYTEDSPEMMVFGDEENKMEDITHRF